MLETGGGRNVSPMARAEPRRWARHVVGAIAVSASEADGQLIWPAAEPRPSEGAC